MREKRGTHYEDIINHDELNQAMSQGISKMNKDRILNNLKITYNFNTRQSIQKFPRRKNHF